MLRNIDPLLSGELLKMLDDMGHGDRLALVDRNYPAYSSGCPVIQLRGTGLLQAAQAILSVLPLDCFVEHPLERMYPDGDPATVTEIQARFLRMASESTDRELVYGAVERHDFYRRVRDSFVVVQTTEDQPYACFMLQKGVV